MEWMKEDEYEGKMRGMGLGDEFVEEGRVGEVREMVDVDKE